MDNRIQINLQDRLMHLLLQQLRNALEMETTRALQQDQLLLEGTELRRLDKLIGRQIEGFLHVKYPGIFLQVTANTNQAIHPFATHQIRHLLIQ